MSPSLPRVSILHRLRQLNALLTPTVPCTIQALTLDQPKLLSVGIPPLIPERKITPYDIVSAIAYLQTL